MKKILFLMCIVFVNAAFAQQTLFMPLNIKKAYDNETRSMDGKPGKNYWQNTANYNIKLTLAPPAKTIRGTETITYFNNSPNPINRPVFKLILNIHAPGAVRQSPVEANYLTQGIVIDKFVENGKEGKFPDAEGSTVQGIRLAKTLNPKESVTFQIDWHYDVSEKDGREGKLDNTSFFLAYFYPRLAVLDDTQGWDRMQFTDAQEFYNDFNNYEVEVNVPKNFIVWGTGDLSNPDELLQPTYLERYKKSLTSDDVINVATQKDIDAKKITTQKTATNTWKWKANNVSDVAYCISDHYVWDAASVVVDKKTGRRASCQSAFIDTAKNFHNQVKHIQHSLDWYSNNFPGVPYPFPKSTIVQGTADMEYPMMANDSPQDDDVIQRFIAEHEIGHSYFPFYMGINEHRYGFMDEGWTTAFEYMIGQADLGKEKGDNFFKQFRVLSWAMNPSDETQLPVITPTNVLSGRGMGDNEYGKPALAYLGLKDMLGDDLFKKSLQGFMERWNGKHPIPWDMFNSFSNLSGKNLDWYWNSWFFSNGYMDIAIEKVAAKNDGYEITLKNIGGFVIPTNANIEYEDGSSETRHFTASIWEQNPAAATVFVSTNNKKIAYVKLDNGIYVDQNEKDNVFGKRKAVAVSSADLDKYVGMYSSKQAPIKIEFKKDGAKLIAQAEGQPPLPLENTGKDTFSFEAANISFVFDTAKNEVTLKQGGQSIVFNKN
jgi:Peptidase family M1 domain